MGDNTTGISFFDEKVQEVGPVKPAPEQLLNTGLRTRIRREGVGGQRFPFPIPNGWFVVSESGAVASGEIKSFYAFGKDLVLFRTEGGEPRLINAYCPHLGAHIGAGGKVEGENIRCPFHGWRYDGASGQCNDIPYGDGGGGGGGKGEKNRIPSGAKLRTYPTLERNHMIWAWHHLEEGEPFCDVPEFPEFNHPDWLPYESLVFDLKTCIQEFTENEVDVAHIKFVHGAGLITDSTLTIDGTYCRVGNDQFSIENFGLGCILTSVGQFSKFAQSLLPLDEENVRLTFWCTAPRAMGDDMARMTAQGFNAGVTQDFAIWENKKYQPKPLLLASEQSILELRKWATQFYSGHQS